MSVARSGLLVPGTPPVVQPGRRVAVDQVGIAQIFERWILLQQDVGRYLPVINSPHAMFPNCWLKRYDITFNGLELAEISLEFGGLADSSDISNMVLPDPQFWPERIEARDPIETHPDFVTALGGTPDEPLNGAIFVDVSAGDTSERKFSHFPANASNEMGGVTDYLTGGIIWRMRYSSTSRPIIDALYVRATPQGPYPRAAVGSDWLLIQDDYTQEGPVFAGNRAWMQSRGRSGKLGVTKGWNPLIYGKK